MQRPVIFSHLLYSILMKSGELIAGVMPYLNAGGYGSRLRNTVPSNSNNGIAKALLRIGQPQIRIIDHQLNALRNAGAKNIIVGAGNQKAVKDYLDRRYSSDAVTTLCSPEQFGTA